jgi:hypothetical protein
MWIGRVIAKHFLLRACRQTIGGLVLAGAAVLAGGKAEAANWWAVSDGATGTVTAMDVEQLACREGICSAPQRAGRPGDRASAGGVHLVDYDCAGLRNREGGGPWRPVPPNSLGEALLTFACTYQARAFGLGVADKMNADGRTFQKLSPITATAATGPAASERVARAQTPLIAAMPPPKMAPAKVASTTPAKASPAPSAPPTAHGARLGVQIAAAASQAQASESLAAVKTRAADVLQGSSSRIDSADVGGRKVYRALLVGFASDAAARQACTSLKAKGVACFVRSVG